ncbi:MAG TPA: MaoC family dehydratase [Nitrososphaeraceae archaeon]|nr:MaoC family dehydratase [Nitrososphaeraceae archaeon]
MIDEKIAAKYKLDDIELGMKKQFKVIITETMANEFAKLSGDYTPLHMDEQYGKNSTFKRKICHGLLLVSFFSRLIGMHLPGENALCMSHTINYMFPGFIDDEITVEGLVINKSIATKIITLKTTITNNSGKCLIDGQAKILVR